uniref:DUF3060 domain-containing protein n=1 Tax=Steinernema glaseri TaxID=37863 RepID=A0A1I7ZFX6_9BILA
MGLSSLLLAAVTGNNFLVGGRLLDAAKSEPTDKGDAGAENIDVGSAEQEVEIGLKEACREPGIACRKAEAAKTRWRVSEIGLEVTCTADDETAIDGAAKRRRRWIRPIGAADWKAVDAGEGEREAGGAKTKIRNESAAAISDQNTLVTNTALVLSAARKGHKMGTRGSPEPAAFEVLSPTVYLITVAGDLSKVQVGGIQKARGNGGRADITIDDAMNIGVHIFEDHVREQQFLDGRG